MTVNIISEIGDVKENMKIIKKILVVVFLFCALGFAQSVKLTPQDSTELATIVNQFSQMQKQLQNDESRVIQEKAILYDLQNQYNAKLKAIEEKKK